MKKAPLISYAVALGLLATSCSTPKNVTYFQDVTDGAVINPIQQLEIKVRPKDKLAILVSTQDPALSNLFNLVQSQMRLGTNSSTTIESLEATVTDGRISYYTVDDEGDINFPVLGKIHIGGMSRFEAASYIEKKLVDSQLVKDPVVTVEFINTAVSVLGEVKSPGRYEFNLDRISIFDAIAMAGDLKPTGMRENVVVLRETEGGKRQAYKVDLTDMASVSASPVFNLQQNDIVYIEPNAKQKRETTASGNDLFTPSFWVTIGSLGITIATLIVTLTK